MGTGIFLSRIAGLVRERAIAHYLGISMSADAFRAALKIPNVLQNLFGEGVLSASFIPVYARLLAEGKQEEATKVARAVGTLLALAASLIALLGVIAAGGLAAVIVPGWHGEKRALTIALIRVVFPGVALLVMSAWCLGVLNSHRRFFLSYVSPVLWNAAIVAAAVIAGRHFAGHDEAIATWLAWGMVIGSAAQFLVQLPTVVALLRSLRPSLAIRDPGVKQTLRTFGPVMLGRGSGQVSAFIDTVIASCLGSGIVAAMANAQVLYLLPISLFGMSISAAELPEMSSALGDASARAEHLQRRLRSALRRVVVLVMPSAIAFLTIGGAIVGLLFQSGRFDARDTQIVWIILAGSSIGAPASTQTRVLGSAFYAMGDAKRPLYASLARVAVASLCGYLFALPVREALGYSDTWGAFGLTASAGGAAWIEMLLLKRWIGARIGTVRLPVALGAGALGASLLAGAAGYAAWHLAPRLHVHGALASCAGIAVFGAVYLGIMAAAGVSEATAIFRRFARR